MSEEPEHDIAEADWTLMAEIQNELGITLQRFIERRIKRRLGGVDIKTLFMSGHNFHKLLVVDMANQAFPDPESRKAFYENARDTWVRGIDELIAHLDADVLRLREEELKSAIHEAEHIALKKKGGE